MKQVAQIVVLAAVLFIFMGIMTSDEAFAEAQKENKKNKRTHCF